jgi:hypothetical protein
MALLDVRLEMRGQSILHILNVEILYDASDTTTPSSRQCVGLVLMKSRENP